MSTFTVRSGLAPVAGMLMYMLAFPGAAGPMPETDLEQAFYDIGVIGYCGLGSAAVDRGYRREVLRIIERDGIDKQGVNAAQSRAMTMVELEWDNRGLGGFRGWCRTDGEKAVQRFLMVPE